MNTVKIYIFLLAALTAACVGYYNVTTSRNMEHLYNPASSMLHPDLTVFHNSDSTSQLFFRINTNELLKIFKNNDSLPIANISILLKVYNSFSEKKIIDTQSVSYDIQINYETPVFSNNILFKTPQPIMYSIEVFISDINRHTTNVYYVNTDKRTVYSRHNFLIQNHKQHTIIFNNYLSNQTFFTLTNNRVRNAPITVKYYSQKNFLPHPPFVTLSLKQNYYQISDSIWSYEGFDNNVFVLPYKGVYKFEIDTTQQGYFMLCNFGNSFPELKQPEELLKPICYITSQKEYLNYNSIDNKKLALDSFWLQTAGSAIRAKELIRIYYSRVTLANLYFSSHIEGWRSDRGMIYIIFGPPPTILKTDTNERWIYGDKQNVSYMNFYFEKDKTNLVDNNYNLIRSEQYKTIWMRAVDTWRNGRVFYLTN